MSIDCEGTLSIELEEFWMFVAGHLPGKMLSGDAEVAFGTPKFHHSEGIMEVPFAVGSVCHPSSWATPPKFLDEMKGD